MMCVGIDVSKKHLDVAVCHGWPDGETDEDIEEAGRFVNEASGIESLTDRLQTLEPKRVNQSGSCWRRQADTSARWPRLLRRQACR